MANLKAAQAMLKLIIYSLYSSYIVSKKKYSCVPWYHVHEWLELFSETKIQQMD